MLIFVKSKNNYFKKFSTYILNFWKILPYTLICPDVVESCEEEELEKGDEKLMFKLTKGEIFIENLFQIEFLKFWPTINLHWKFILNQILLEVNFWNFDQP